WRAPRRRPSACHPPMSAKAARSPSWACSARNSRRRNSSSPACSGRIPTRTAPTNSCTSRPASASRSRSPTSWRSTQGARASSPSLPDAARRLDHDLELALLVVGADEIADDVRGEAALRADCQLLERDVPGRLVDALSQLVDLLDFRHLGGDEAEHDHLALGHEAQGGEAAGARRVIFEHEAVVRQLVEQPLGDGVVGALAVPHAALVAAAEMDA